MPKNRMRSIHDNNIYSLEVACEQKTIVLHTEFHESESAEFTDIEFRGVVGHHFEHILKNNILFDVEQWPPDKFFETYQKELMEYYRYGLSISFNGIQEFISELTKSSLKTFVINSSYGLSGWVISEEMCLKEKYEKKA